MCAIVMSLQKGILEYFSLMDGSADPQGLVIEYLPSISSPTGQQFILK